MTQTPLPHRLQSRNPPATRYPGHSLYTEREIFLRELISNASDALTRWTRATHQPRGGRSQAALAIRITPDEEAKTLTITDTGIA